MIFERFEIQPARVLYMKGGVYSQLTSCMCIYVYINAYAYKILIICQQKIGIHAKKAYICRIIVKFASKAYMRYMTHTLNNF